MRLNNNHRWINCPLCNSENIAFIGEIDYRKPIMFSTSAIELMEMPELYKCRICESWFSQNIISENNAFEMYSKGSSCDKWPRDVAFANDKSANIRQRLDQYFHTGKSILDIGCNTGLLLDYARSKGCFTSGVEPSSESRNLVSNKGHTTFSSIENVVDKYDVITAFDLLEHIYDVPGFLNMISQLLLKNGVMLLLTGDIQSLSARLTKNNWWYLKAPEHIVFPSRKFLASLEGFELQSIDNTYAKVGYDRPKILGIIQYIRKNIFYDGYDGLPSIGPDHMLVTLKNN